MPLITDEQSLVSARYHRGEYTIPTYDDGFGELFISRCSIGILGIVRARTWEDAYGICEDEFFPSADEDAFEKPWDEMTEHEQACWDEAYGYRPNGRGGPTPDHDRGIYAKDLNGDYLDALTPRLVEELGIVLEIKDNE